MVASDRLLAIPRDTVVHGADFPPHSTQAIYTPDSLLHVLQYTKLDNQGVIIMAHLVRSSIPFIPHQQAAQIFHFLIRKVCSLTMLSLLPAVVNMFFQRMQMALRAGDIENPSIQYVYADIIDAFSYMAQAPRTSTRRQEIGRNEYDYRLEIVRITRHLIQVLESLPSSSAAQRPLPLVSELVRSMCNIKVVSEPLSSLLVDYARASGTRIRRADVQAYFAATAQEGNVKRAGSLLRLKMMLDKGSEEDMVIFDDIGRQNIGKEGIFGDDVEQHSTPDRDQMDDACEAVVDEDGMPLYTTPGAEKVSRSSADRSLDGEEPTVQEHLVSNFALRAFHEFSAVVQPYLSHPDPSRELSPAELETREYAWSMLLTRAGEQRSITRKQIMDLYAYMPEFCICAHTLAPVMRTLVRLNEMDEAWKVWLDAVRLEKESERKGRYVDRVILAIATEVCAKTHGLETAVSLVDIHARRTRPGVDPDLERLPLDPQNVNILLWQCAQVLVPSVAFRIWTAAFPRWGVRLNGISLGMLLNVARRCEFSDNFDARGEDHATQFRLLMEELSLRRKKRGDLGALSDYEAYDADGFSKGDYRSLLDPPGYKWSDDWGTTRPWERAREVFRDVVLTNWPHLVGMSSPLELEWNPLNPVTIFGGRIKPSKAVAHLTALPSPKSRFTHIVPTPLTWHYYILLLGTFGQVHEIPLTLAWMKALGVKPIRYTLTDSLTYVAEVEGPRRWVRGWREGRKALVRDEEILRRWMEDWLGDGYEEYKGKHVKIVPDAEEVREYRMEIAGSGRTLIL